MSNTWQQVLTKIRGKISEVNYNAWFAQVDCVDCHDNEIKLAVPNSFTKEWLNDYYNSTIQEELHNITGRQYRIDYEIREEDLNLESAPSLSITRPRHEVSSAPALVQSTPPATGPARNTVKAPLADGLNPRYGFDKFVVGADNQFAYAACKAVGDLPGGHYNPLFIYGGVGLGKTHLINGIGIALQERHSHLRVLYISSERFMNELINAIRFDKMGDFRKKYRDSCDVLIMDDIQFIAGKERTQEEFFHTFNCLYEAGKQIVVTSDKFPKDIPGLEDRLRSRFEWGLIADIQAPDLETRIAILHKKSEINGIQLTDDVALYLAQQIRSNVRELEGSLIRLAAYSSLNAMPINLQLAQQVLKNLLREERPKCSVESIQKMVADYFHIKISDMKSARRMKHLAFPRQIAMYLCKKHIKCSYPELGQKFGGKDHTTVMHACRKIDKQLTTDERLQDDVSFLEQSLTRN